MKKKYWYKYFTDYCPLCGREDTWKERIYDKPKPDNYEERHIWDEVWDYCGL